MNLQQVTQELIMKAVIIAAGSGSRLESRHNGIPKTLLKIGNRSIIDIILEGIRRVGINEATVVTGYRADVLEDYLRGRSSASLRISFCHNPRWHLSNGISVLCAEDSVKSGEEFVLLMSDHIFQPEMLELTVNTPVEQDQALLAIDFKLNSIPDIDDGMKVKCSRKTDRLYEITGLNKTFEEYQAIDCGMFKLNHSYFGVLRRSIQEGKTSLSDACNVLAADGRMAGVDIGANRWIDIDTPEMFSFGDIISSVTDSLKQSSF
jgi:choline kinase